MIYVIVQGMPEYVNLRAAELKIDLLHNIIMIILVHCSCDTDHRSAWCMSESQSHLYSYT